VSRPLYRRWFTGYLYLCVPKIGFRLGAGQRLEAEQAAELVEASESQARIAACNAAAAKKRTRKPKRE